MVLVRLEGKEKVQEIDYIQEKKDHSRIALSVINSKNITPTTFFGRLSLKLQLSNVIIHQLIWLTWPHIFKHTQYLDPSHLQQTPSVHL